jgi:hypothetical protein
MANKGWKFLETLWEATKIVWGYIGVVAVAVAVLAVQGVLLLATSLTGALVVVSIINAVGG